MHAISALAQLNWWRGGRVAITQVVQSDCSVQQRMVWASSIVTDSTASQQREWGQWAGAVMSHRCGGGSVKLQSSQGCCVGL